MFTGTNTLIIKLGMRAVQELGWNLKQANETLGLLTFETNMSWGSYTGVSCSLQVEEVSKYRFRVDGTGKQNVRGGQLVAFDIGGEAKGKVRKAIDMMRMLAGPPARNDDEPAANSEPPQNDTNAEASSSTGFWSWLLS